MTTQIMFPKPEGPTGGTGGREVGREESKEGKKERRRQGEEVERWVE